MTHDELLVKIEDAIAEARDDMSRLNAAYGILTGAAADENEVGRMIYLNRSRRISDLAEEARLV